MDEARDARRRAVKEVWWALEREQKCDKAEADALMQRLKPLAEDAKTDSLLAEYIQMTQVGHFWLLLVDFDAFFEKYSLFAGKV